jgi:actin-like ATPase involved in cell morphogenesis
MTYAVAFDLGTTFSSAAVFCDGSVEMVSFDEGTAVASAVALDDDGLVEFGATALRRLVPTPERVVTEFKRRVGSPDPILVGSARFPAEELMALHLRHLLDQIEAERGEPAAGLTVCHPAMWSAYKCNLLAQAIGRVTDVPLSLISEPAAAATWYAQKNTVKPGETIGVYDLGGGTFDIALMRRSDDGFDFVGDPSGHERLGGIDFDDVVLGHVESALGDRLDGLAFDEPAVAAAYAQLETECIRAKVALSSATDVSIPVLIPGVFTTVRLTRVEFEELIRERVDYSVEVFRHVLDIAGLAPSDLTTVLLVGGSSRIPLIAESLRASLQVTTSVDAHPKHAIALGAAWFAGTSHFSAQPPVPLRRADVSEYTALGSALRHERRFDEADEALSAALAIAPDDLLSLGLRGDVRRLLGRPDEARVDADRALALDPRHVLARTVRAALDRSAGNNRGALADIGHALESQPDASWPLALQADLYLRERRFDDAVRSANRALASDPQHLFALSRRGELHRLAGEFALAQQCFARVLERDPGNPWVLERVGLDHSTEVAGAH